MTSSPVPFSATLGPPLTRGGRKLEAAIARFDLAGAIAGKHAVDVGASTGGFVAVLLAAGAARVTAVDVGHGQLAPELAADARVENLEKTDWKRLPLAEAPGPFGFFTVDVSFTAARTMLRGLAFRLRAGAHGVVLLKPQFELPGRLVRRGQVEDPGLRRRALEVFHSKAEALNFRVLEHADSPVPGGSGTVEILAHLVFDGRPDHLPRPGERKSGRPPPEQADPRAQAPRPGERKSGRPRPEQADPRAQAPRPGERKSGRPRPGQAAPRAEGVLDWFAVAAPGLEAPLRAEVERLEAVTSVRAVPGGVEFCGPLLVGMAANLHLRIATRVLVRLGQIEARDFAPLRRRAAALDWPAFLPTDRPLRIDASASHCRLYHTKALAEAVRNAVTDRLGPLPEARRREEDRAQDDEELSRVLIRGEDDRFTISVDSSGALLHRRGWRVETGRAPLRETLAAGLLALCGYDARTPFFDPMCGAGTIVLEACSAALHRAPGLGRHFACERWPCWDEERWAAARAAAQAEVLPAPPAAIFGSDRDARAVEIARRNAERAGFAPHVRLAVADFEFASEPPATPPGLLLVNPPYGRRLGHPREAVHLGRDLGRILASRHAGWRAGVLSPHPAFARAVATGARREIVARHDLCNGGLRVQLLVL